MLLWLTNTATATTTSIRLTIIKIFSSSSSSSSSTKRALLPSSSNRRECLLGRLGPSYRWKASRAQLSRAHTEKEKARQPLCVFFSRKSEVINKTDKYKLKPTVLTVAVVVAVAHRSYLEPRAVTPLALRSLFGKMKCLKALLLLLLLVLLLLLRLLLLPLPTKPLLTRLCAAAAPEAEREFSWLNFD